MLVQALRVKGGTSHEPLSHWIISNTKYASMPESVSQDTLSRRRKRKIFVSR